MFRYFYKGEGRGKGKREGREGKRERKREGKREGKKIGKRERKKDGEKERKREGKGREGKGPYALFCFVFLRGPDIYRNISNRETCVGALWALWVLRFFGARARPPPSRPPVSTGRRRVSPSIYIYTNI